MIYKIICKTDQIILTMSSSIILLTRLLLPRDIWYVLGCSSFIICWGGWESWWSLGYTPSSLNYHHRAILCQFSEVTKNLYLHSIIAGISDISIALYVFSLTTYFVPSGLYEFNWIYYQLLIFCALIQNKLITMSKITPVTNGMSWAPLAHNSDCRTLISCWNNQQEWFYAISIMYCIILNIF